MRHRHPSFAAFLLCALMLIGLLAFPVRAQGPRAPEEKPVLKFAVLSDPHFMLNGPDSSWRMLKGSPYLLEDALRQVNSAGGVQFILFTGDIVNDPRRHQLDGFFETMQRMTKIPYYLVLGDRDVGVLPERKKADTLALLRQKAVRGFTVPGKGYYVFSPSPQVVFIVLDGTTDATVTNNGSIPEEELVWLKKQLEAARDKTVFVALHYPVVEPLESPSRRIQEPDAAKLLSLLESSPNVAAVFSGHYHTARISQRNGIYHFSEPSLIEYPNAFRIYSVYGDGGIEAEWRYTRLRTMQEMSRERSPWPLEASGDPGKDQRVQGMLRFFPSQALKAEKAE